MTPDAQETPGTATTSGPAAPHDSTPPDLLLADPDEAVAADVMARFERAGVSTVVCHDGAEALLQIGLCHPGAVLLGAPLPLVNAARVAELTDRLHPVPVLVGAGPNGGEEATDALAAGAVAIVARPYRADEILPLLTAGRNKSHPEIESLIVGDIELDLAGFHTYVHGRPVQLPPREFLLLRYLMERVNRVVSRAELTHALWGVKELESNSLTVHIRRLRRKLQEGSSSCCTIDSIRGFGYRLECGAQGSIPPPDSAENDLHNARAHA